VFAHNGDLPDIEHALPLAHAAHRPMGQTDSEHAFYVLMHDLIPLDTAGGSDDLKRRIERVAEFANRLRAIGPANFLYTDGDLLFAHAHRRLSHPGNTWVPGLHMLTREAASEHQVRALGLHIQGRDDRPAPAVLLASVPLTPEVWEPLPENTLLVLQQGRLIARITS